MIVPVTEESTLGSTIAQWIGEWPQSGSSAIVLCLPRAFVAGWDKPCDLPQLQHLRIAYKRFAHKKAAPLRRLWLKGETTSWRAG